jgi:Fur family ferric uptake transcriptional regulator
MDPLSCRLVGSQSGRCIREYNAMCPRQHSLVDLSKGPGAEALRDLLDAYMVEHGLRATEQRRLIIDAFMASEPHVSIDELLAQVRKKDGRIGYATVYRTLKMLAESGIAHERHFDDGFARYELADTKSHHDHLICTACGKIVEFEEPGIEKLQLAIAERHGFDVTHHRHELYGVCAECRKAASTKVP